MVRRGRGAGSWPLDQTAVLPAGTVREVVGGGWEGEAILDRLGMGDLVDAEVGRAVRRPGQAGGAGPGPGGVGETSEGDLLVLDEPTNHLDMDAIAWLEERLAGFTGGLVLVTHDRHVLDRVTTRILELDRGRATSTRAATPPTWTPGPSGPSGRPAPSASAATWPGPSWRGCGGVRRPAPASPRRDIAAARAVVEGRAPSRPGPTTCPSPTWCRCPAWATPWSSCTT